MNEALFKKMNREEGVLDIIRHDAWVDDLVIIYQLVEMMKICCILS